MPTFERCQRCVADGIASDEAPIVPEGKACLRHTPEGRELSESMSKKLESMPNGGRCPKCGKFVIWGTGTTSGTGERVHFGCL
jgi:hypothetical protein